MNPSLADRQAELVRALVGGATPPSGFDADRLRAASIALLHKRMGEVERVWPTLLLEPVTRGRFMEWAAGRPKSNSFTDGIAFAEHLAATGDLPLLAAEELRSIRRRTRRRTRRRQRR